MPGDTHAAAVACAHELIRQLAEENDFCVGVYGDSVNAILYRGGHSFSVSHVFDEVTVRHAFFDVVRVIAEDLYQQMQKESLRPREK